MEVIDYSECCFGTPLPPQRKGKFVLIQGLEKQWAIFAPYDLCTYHANIVARFLKEQKIKGDYNARGDGYFFDSSQWEVEGGGHWKIDEDAKKLHIFGASQRYGGVNLSTFAGELEESGVFDSLEIVLRP